MRVKPSREYLKWVMAKPPDSPVFHGISLRVPFGQKDGIRGPLGKREKHLGLASKTVLRWERWHDFSRRRGSSQHVRPNRSAAVQRHPLIS